jgi:hypothetical protein
MKRATPASRAQSCRSLIVGYFIAVICLIALGAALIYLETDRRAAAARALSKARATVTFVRNGAAAGSALRPGSSAPSRSRAAILFSASSAFCDYDILNPARFVGFANYLDVQRDQLFWKSVSSTAA